MYAKANKTNKMNSQTNRNMNNTMELKRKDSSTSENENNVHNDFYYRKEHEDYVSRLNVQKAFYFNRM